MSNGARAPGPRADPETLAFQRRAREAALPSRAHMAVSQLHI
eukprot:COSAG02_NODE_12108_length_1594_cov_7.822074_1_plen_41_part_10